MTFDQEVALCASVGSCASAIATFWTVRQMQRQRADSYRPDLVMGTSGFEARADGDSKIFNQWDLPGARPERAENYVSNCYAFLYNLGLGPARNVRLTWSFPLEETIRDLKALKAKKRWDGSVGMEDGGLLTEFDSHSTYFPPWDEDNTQAVDFILPASIAKEPQQLLLPDEYSELYSIYHHVVLLHSPKGVAVETLMEGFPALTANLHYQDIGGAAHKVAFDLKMSFTGIPLKDGAIFGEIHCTRRSLLSDLKAGPWKVFGSGGKRSG